MTPNDGPLGVVGVIVLVGVLSTHHLSFSFFF